MEQDKVPSTNVNSVRNDRREFLKKCGKYAVVTPPAITMLLSTSLTSDAIAKSGGGGGGGKGGGRGKGGDMGNKIGWYKNGKW